MNWVDAGINLLDARFILAEVLERAAQNEVNHMLVIASTLAEAEQALALRKHPPSAVIANNIQLAYTAGIHPHYANDTSAQTWLKLNQIIADNSVAAIGECGLDFNRNFSSQANQLYAFEKQLDIAATNNMGVYLHERDAFNAQIRLLEQYSESLNFMVAHCFTGNKEQLAGYLELGCYIGVTGWLCDAKRGIDLQDAVLELPLSRLLLETDGPYLFPKTLKPRKSLNEPCNIPYIASAFASITGSDINKVKEHTYNNACKLFFTERSE